MFVNLFPYNEALVETSSQGDAPVTLQVSEEAAEVIARLVQDDAAASGAIAAVFLAGVRAGERAVATGRRTVPARPS